MYIPNGGINLRRHFAGLFLTVAMLVCLSTPVMAAEYATMEQVGKAIYQVDKETINFQGEGTDKSVEVWLRIIETDKPGAYSLVHFFIKENMTYMKKEHTRYSSGVVLSSADFSEKGWMPLPAESPLGHIAKRLFADYRESEASKAPAITADPQELKKALEDERIKEKENKDGTKSYYVRDKRGPALFSGIYHYVTLDFYASFDAKHNRSTVLHFSIEDTRAGGHMLKEAVTIVVDGKEWVLTPPLTSDVSGYSSANFKHTYRMPAALVNALTATKGAVTVKWKHRYNNNWDDHERVIPDKVLHDIQLMYAGCK